MPYAARLVAGRASLVRSPSADVTTQRSAAEQVHDPSIQLRRKHLDRRPAVDRAGGDEDDKGHVTEQVVDPVIQADLVAVNELGIGRGPEEDERELCEEVVAEVVRVERELCEPEDLPTRSRIEPHRQD